MAADDDAFEAVRSEIDPVRRGRLATELLAVYGQRTTELARLRREAVRRLQLERSMSYATIADAFGLSKGRIGQITQTGPRLERGLFGVGPVTVAVPLRPGHGRSLPVIASEDALAAERLTEFLHDLQFEVEQYRIPVGGAWKPAGDVVAICGPKSSPVTARALRTDPVLDYHKDSGDRWVITDRESGAVYQSPMDDTLTADSDVAYLGRLPTPNGTTIFVAGIHALGSVGAVDYLIRNAGELYQAVGDRRFSLVIRSEHDGETVLRSEALCPPRLHERCPGGSAP